MTVAYIPLVRTHVESNAKERSRLRRCGVLQRVLYACMRTAIAASHFGAEVTVGGRKLLAFPRLLLYVCDQLEERAILCLKTGMCQRPCSQCDVKQDVIGSIEALDANQRDVVEMLERQMEASGHRQHNRERERRETLEALDSLTGFVPALAAMAGLSTSPYLLYKMIGFDALHVRSYAEGTPLVFWVCMDPIRGYISYLTTYARHSACYTDCSGSARRYLTWGSRGCWCKSWSKSSPRFVTAMSRSLVQTLQVDAFPTCGCSTSVAEAKPAGYLLGTFWDGTRLIDRWPFLSLAPPYVSTHLYSRSRGTHWPCCT